MKKITLILLALCLSLVSTSQSKYSKLRIWGGNEVLRSIAEAGVTVEHGIHKRDTWYVSDFSDQEIAILDKMGINYDVLIDDVQAYYQSRLESPDQQNHRSFMLGDPHFRSHRSNCGSAGGGTSFTDPSNFNLGSMGGYLTYTEFIAEIDDMAAQYPNLITAKAPISTFQTHQGRDIYWMRISDNPNTDETEPEILYTAIHHAREPGSLMQLVYYMWYLLENYGTDPEVTYLVDNTEMYFVPMINPDGYIRNEITDPNGGGMHRKNMRDNSDGSFGVDLNRNYSYQFGFSGTSNNTSADNYLGPFAFSEPETQAIKWFAENRNFEIAMNYHTYGNLLLHPFGYDYIQTADHTQFQEWSGWMVRNNGFSNILSANLYPAAGDSDDWMYADDLATKPKIMAMTPEVGSDSHGFWPATAEILPIVRGCLIQNLTAAHLLLNYGKLEDAEPYVVETTSGHFNYDITRLGLETGTLTVEILPIGPWVTSVGTSKTYNLSLLQGETDSITYDLDPGIAQGQEFQYVLTLSNGQTELVRDTLTKVYGLGNVVIADNGNTLSNWNTSTWNTTSAEFYSASSSITDSPGGDYPNNTQRTITLSNSFDLTNAVSATLSFYAKWEIEDNYDYVQVSASTDGSTWTPLCGLYTNDGTNDQELGEPLYDGFQTSWIREEMSLQDFLGSANVQIRFRLISDVWVNEDGFYFDDLEVNVIENTVGIQEQNDLLLAPMPNPADQFTYIQFDQDVREGTIEILDQTGRIVLSEPVSATAKQQVITSGLSNGVYLVRLNQNGTLSGSEKLVIFR